MDKSTQFPEISKPIIDQHLYVPITPPSYYFQVPPPPKVIIINYQPAPTYLKTIKNKLTD